MSFKFYLDVVVVSECFSIFGIWGIIGTPHTISAYKNFGYLSILSLQKAFYLSSFSNTFFFKFCMDD